MQKRVHVAVGVIHRADGCILIAQRAAKQHLGGLWEFPGGKVEAGETVSEALSRELYEELGIITGQQSPLCRIQHDYTDKSVLLDVWHVHDFTGEAHGREGQPLRWVSPQALVATEFPEANRAIIRALSLPDFLAVFPADASTDQACEFEQFILNCPDSSLLRWRSPNLPAAERVDSANRQGVRLVMDLADAADKRWQQLAGISGIHANRHVLQQLTSRPACNNLLFGASCHNLQELQQAARLGADYVLLSPVLATQSHPDQAGMGWKQFATLATASHCPVYAMGGLQKSDLQKAKTCGARGIAGISLFNNKDGNQLR